MLALAVMTSKRILKCSKREHQQMTEKHSRPVKTAIVSELFIMETTHSVAPSRHPRPHSTDHTTDHIVYPEP